jgi:chromosome segregation ATPase
MFGHRLTPRTDAVRFRVGESDHWAVHEVYAKQLERELAEARAEGEDQARLLGMSGEREAGLLAEIDQLKRERDNAETDRRQAETDTIRALHERNEARGQRDRLATVLRDIKNRALDETVRLHPDADAKGCVDDCLEWAESALAALKGGTDA